MITTSFCRLEDFSMPFELGTPFLPNFLFILANDVLLKASISAYATETHEIWIGIFIIFSKHGKNPVGGEKGRVSSKWTKPIMRVFVLSLVRYENTLRIAYKVLGNKAYVKLTREVSSEIKIKVDTRQWPCDFFLAGDSSFQNAYFVVMSEVKKEN